jgi:hypothetical protein
VPLFVLSKVCKPIKPNLLYKRGIPINASRPARGR